MAQDALGQGKINFRDLLLFIICRSTRPSMTVQQMVDNKLVTQESAADLNQLGKFEPAFASVQQLWADDASYTPPPCPDIPELQAMRSALDSSKRLSLKAKK